MSPFTAVRIFAYQKYLDSHHNPDVLPCDYMELYDVPDPNKGIVHFLIRLAEKSPVPVPKLKSVMLITATNLSILWFQMQTRFKLVSKHDKMSVALDGMYGGICLVDKENETAFHQSIAHCKKRQLPPHIHTIWADNNLLPYLDIALDLTNCNPQLPTPAKLHLNGVFEWAKDSLPDFVEAKKKQLEAKRIWSDWEQLHINHILPMSDFVVFEPNTRTEKTSGIPSSAAAAAASYTEYGFLSTLNLHSLAQPVADIFKHVTREEIFTPLFQWTQSMCESEGLNTTHKFVMPRPAQSWPNQMGFLNFQSADVNVSGDPELKAEWEKQMLHLTTHSKSDTTLVCGFKVHFFGEIFSRQTTPDKRGNLRQMLVHAAFYVRFVNLALQMHTCCIAAFCNWQGECMLVFEHTDKNVYYHMLKCHQGNDSVLGFVLDQCHSQAQFHLRLLNVGNPHNHQFTEAQQIALGRIWVDINAAPRDSEIAALYTTSGLKRKRETESLPEESVQVQKLAHGVYLVEPKSGPVCVRKILHEWGSQELKVYKWIKKYDPRRSDHIIHFISEWSTVTWRSKKCLELPAFVSVGKDIRHEQGAHLKGHTVLLCGQLSNAINFLHTELKVAHMDIKPDNLVLDVKSNSKPTLKIIDFNVSISDAAHMKACGACGTMGYMAPEVQENKSYFPFLADQYSSGVCMMEFLGLEDQADCDLCYKAFAVFAEKLCNWSPMERPSLTKCPRLYRKAHVH
ncbi:kinase-like protein [Gymnopus androsaceus JB14]|uniref:Kinase-like protein n=1 Tax=Gymnopus androsaceus JB14 TaxID=1447944 RepID=A0A6A4HKI7_9AGAR|nr:kinase-like protein [Gymnopus androsaceus JB14]